MNSKTVALAAGIAALSWVACKKFGTSDEKARDLSERSSQPDRPPPSKGSEVGRLHEEGNPPTSPPVPEDAIGQRHQHDEPVNHLTRAAELSRLAEPDGALAEARRALFDDPDDADALIAVAKLGEKAGQKRIAIEALGRLARIRGDDAKPLVRQARLLISTRDFRQAERVARDAIARDPENPEGYQAAGRAYLGQGQLAPAIRMFSQVIDLSPDHGHALNNLGFAYLLSGQNDEAVEVLTQAAELLPDLAYVQNNLGVALERTDRMDEARSAFAKSIDLSPRYLKAQLNAQRLQRLASTQEMPDQVEIEDTCLEPDEAPQE